MPLINHIILQIITSYCFQIGSDNLYYKKVEISGINTASLPVLTEDERTILIQKMKNGDKKAKDMLVMSNLKLVLSIIQKVNGRNIDADDLFQVGCIGLIKALNNFDINLNVQFSTYGVVMILGEIKRYIRDNSAVRISRSTKDLAYKALAFKEEYVKHYNCDPAPSDIAQALGVNTYQVCTALEALSPAVSLYEPVYGEESEGLYIVDRISVENFEDGFCSKMVILDVLHRLKSREKYIINLRYVQGKTQSQVADIIGISQAQVSRIEKNVLRAVKKELSI